MKTRAAFVAAIVASVLSSVNASAAPDAAEPAPAADQCLTSPREYTPPGTRWRYRIERSTGRHCWFLKDNAEKAAGKAAAEQSTAATEEPASAPPRKKSATSRSVSDARAELSKTPVEQDIWPAPVQSAPAPAGAPVVDNNQSAPAKAANNMLAPAAATRWPDPISTTAPANVAANPPAAPADQAADVRSAPVDARTAPATLPAKPPAMPRVVPPAPDADKPMSLPMLITIVAGGLSVLGVLVSLLFAWLSSRRTRLTPSVPMPSLEVPDASRRPGDLYRERMRLREQRSGRRAA